MSMCCVSVGVRSKWQTKDKLHLHSRLVAHTACLLLLPFNIEMYTQCDAHSTHILFWHSQRTLKRCWKCWKNENTTNKSKLLFCSFRFLVTFFGLLCWLCSCLLHTSPGRTVPRLMASWADCYTLLPQPCCCWFFLGGVKAFFTWILIGKYFCCREGYQHNA